MKKLLFFIILNSLNNLSAQNLINNNYFKAGSNDARVIDHIIDIENNTIVMVQFSKSLEINPNGLSTILNSNSVGSAFIGKYDSNGILKWHYQINALDPIINSTSNNISIHGYTANNNHLSLDINNNIYVHCAFIDSIILGYPIIDSWDTTSSLNTIMDAFILKLSSNGTFKNVHYFNNSETNISINMAHTIDKNIYCNIFSKGTILLKTTSGLNSYNIGQKSTLICKLDTNLNAIWSAPLTGNTFAPKVTRLELDNDNRILIGGGYCDNLDFDPSVNIAWAPNTNYVGVYSNNSFIDVLDSNGNFVWGKGFGNSLPDYITTLTHDSKNNIYVGGIASDSIDLDPSSNVFYKVCPILGGSYITKLSSSGTFINGAILDGTKNLLNQVIINKNDELILTGIIQDTIDLDPSSSIFQIINSNKFSLTKPFLSKLDSMLKFIWGFSFDGYNNAFFYTNICIDNYNNIIYSSDLRPVFQTSKFMKVDIDPGVNVTNIYDTIFTSLSYGNTRGLLIKISDKCIPLKDTVSFQACDSFISPNNNSFYATGDYWVVNGYNKGCINLRLYKLAIGHTQQVTIGITACEKFVTGSGRILTSSGVYFDTIKTSTNCDSFITYYLIINKADASFTQHLDNLTANNLNAISYQWYNCITQSIVPGATSPIFYTTSPYGYALIINANDCIDTSACLYPLKSKSLENNKLLYTISPNPSHLGKAIILFSNTQQNIKIEIFNDQGILVFSDNKINAKQLEVTLPFIDGVYFIKINTANGFAFDKIIVD